MLVTFEPVTVPSNVIASGGVPVNSRPESSARLASAIPVTSSMSAIATKDTFATWFATMPSLQQCNQD